MRLSVMMIAALLVPLSLSSQVFQDHAPSSQILKDNRQQKFPHEIPAGNYSGITPVGNDRYAVVSDKTADGFYLFHIDIDTLTGRIRSVVNEGFRSTGLACRDQEGIAFQPFARTLFISGEADNQVFEYTPDGQRTGRRLKVPESFCALNHNCGLESLCYDAEARCFYTIAECPTANDSVLWLTQFDDEGNLVRQYPYKLDSVKPKRRGVLLTGVSELCSLGDGCLLVLERTLRETPLKIGSYVETRLYEVRPASGGPLRKKNLYKNRTKLNLLRQNFANYEGLCVAHRLADGSVILLMVADSQNQYRGLLRDWMKTLIVRKGAAF